MNLWCHDCACLKPHSESRFLDGDEFPRCDACRRQRSMPDGYELLGLAVYGRPARVGEVVGGGRAALLKDAADEIGRLRETIGNVMKGVS